ncbi:hypothetical protein QTL97_06780 [Sporosarcina thermotolerans]|uniref:ABC transporter permease n=1 Tax=Sporosarcina thermotolerans TaxID=633404 RepID=A0AAW9A6M2_9BACL|nr:hypothetical protein [Sporosarcina thermotolerans]MDW0116634.1 hypothetical protein [Sporosarcina thermotolerans]
MKQWNGLLQKEWVQWRVQIIVLVLLMLTGLFVFPTFAKVLTAGEVPVFEITMIISFVAAGACVFVPVIAFATMFNKEMKRPDLWLHSTASTSKLIGVKLFMAAVMGFAYLLVPVVVVAIRYLFTSHPEVMFSELLFVGVLLISAVFLASIQFMVYGFFFIVIDQLLKPFLKGFSIIITIVLFIISARIYGEVMNSVFYERFIKIGRFDLLSIKSSNIHIQYENFAFSNTVLYFGEIAFAIFFTVGLLYLAITLFEKRVRL